jgi:prepilin-type N-terminal cleavage/methylation domain-containing protein
MSARRGFTLLELLLAVTILAVAMTVAFATFGVVTTAWRKGTRLADEIHHGDFVMEQLVMALRSATYPDAKAMSPPHGFRMEDNGDDAESSDVISWVKQGGALVGHDEALAGGPHRVVFQVADDDETEDRVVRIKAWRLEGQPEDFDPEEDVEPVVISRRVRGFNCRTAFEKDADEGIDWLDEWEDTNRLPVYVEIALYMEPLDAGEDPVEIKRALTIPTAPLSWGIILEEDSRQALKETGGAAPPVEQ